MMEYCSTHCEMSVTGSLAGAGVRPGVWAIFSYFRHFQKFEIFFTTLWSVRLAVGLNGLGEFSLSPALLAGYASGFWDVLVCLAPGLGLLLLQMPKCPAH